MGLQAEGHAALCCPRKELQKVLVTPLADLIHALADSVEPIDTHSLSIMIMGSKQHAGDYATC